MDFVIEKKQDGKYVDLVLTFSNGKRFVLVPLTPKDNYKMKSYFYALLNSEQEKVRR